MRYQGALREADAHTHTKRKGEYGAQRQELEV